MSLNINRNEIDYYRSDRLLFRPRFKAEKNKDITNNIKAYLEQVISKYAGEQYLHHIDELLEVKFNEEDNHKMQWGVKYHPDGLFIGQFNFWKQFNGRGMFIYNSSIIELFIGPFVAGMRHGPGVEYINGKKLQVKYVVDRPEKCLPNYEANKLNIADEEIEDLAFHDAKGMEELPGIVDVLHARLKEIEEIGLVWMVQDLKSLLDMIK